MEVNKANSKVSKEKLSPKVDSIARCIMRIESKQPFALEDLQADFDLQDIISTNISRAIQLCVDIGTMVIARSQSPLPGEMAECFSALHNLKWIDAQTATKMKKSVGLRNIMIHEYEKIDWQIVHDVVSNHLEDIKSYVKQILDKTP